ncbi:FHA domain-containing protein [Pseudonocardia sp. MH-G8]|uniref:FHA domain-containing protein n=1 Tax=Pseudonocardia sp. MH-G8 TaxID=1854588 RepID=UPI000BA07FEC|nr:FHA domain-containing protein [Pseudonocardia sp. MH-G8]OZM83518.1 phosphopeptide-binding protein [Pseudonocardia sp. MH-G8]
MPTCPAGHDSVTTDYCDDCGAPMGVPREADPAATAGLGAVTPAEKRCPACGEPRDGRFCEVCGHDAERPAPAPVTPPADPGERPAAPPWTALVRADREWFDRVRARGGSGAAALQFPPYCPERRFVLAGPQLAVGRRSRSRGVEPEIDLSGPPLDPGVSTLHALLLPAANGGWQLIDLDSTNGTVLNDAADPIAPNRPVPLTTGDRIRLGAWTTITVTASP